MMLANTISIDEVTTEFTTSLPKLNLSFTTPFLDFEDHSGRLGETIDRLYDFNQNKLQSSLFQDESRQEIVVRLCFEVLMRFNTLTRPPQKKYKTINSTVYTPSEVTEKELREISTHNFDPTLSNHQKAYYHYLRGKLFNISENYNQSAEKNLCAAVKLNPKLMEAWKQLGECFWKKGDLEAAENCFQWIVDFEGSPSSLTLLSMVQRRKSKDRKSLEKSIHLCKEALKLDIKYSNAWVGLGASYMSMYFNVSRNSKDLKLALKAYDKADVDSANPDLYQSRAIIHQYFENYSKAIADLKRASELDYRLECIYVVESINSFMEDLTYLLTTKMDLSMEYIQSIQRKFPLKTENEVDIQTAQSWTAKSFLKLYILKSVKRYNEAVGSSFIAIDSLGHFCAFTILNIQNGVIKVGDFVLASSPVLVLFGPKKLPIVRVDDPYQIEINSNRVSIAQMAWVEMRVEAKK